MAHKRWTNHKLYYQKEKVVEIAGFMNLDIIAPTNCTRSGDTYYDHIYTLVLLLLIVFRVWKIVALTSY